MLYTLPRMRKVIIFGAGGLIGMNLCRSLSSVGMEIIPTARSNRYHSFYESLGLKFEIIDITDRKDFNKLPESGVDVVVLAAAYLPAAMKGYHPEQYIENNTLGALNVLEYCRRAHVKQIIYFQSHSDVSGHWGNGLIDPYTPKSVNYNNDHSVYVISKIAAEELIKHYHAAYGLSYCVLRCPNIYAWQPREFYYYNGEKKYIAYRKIIRQAINSEPIEIWGNCKVKRDMVYIKDLEQLVIKSIEKEVDSSIYNVSTGEGTTLEEEIKAIVRVFCPSNSPSPIIYRPEISVIESNHRYSIDNAVKEIGYEPQFDCEAMFRDMKKEMDSHFWDFIKDE